MTRFERVLDGSGQHPRPIQLDYFGRLATEWPTRVHALEAPPGVGKSYIARTVQRTLGYPDCVILTPNNMLVDQYGATYKDLNVLKGKDYYDDDDDYRRAKERALSVDTVFNPLSFYYFSQRANIGRPSVIVVDEAHKLADMLVLTLTQDLALDYYGIPEGLTEPKLLDWLGQQVTRLEAALKIADKGGLRGGSKAAGKLTEQYERLKLLHDYLRANLHTIRIEYTEREHWKTKRKYRCLSTQPLTVPVTLLDTMFGKSCKILLFSGTLTPWHVAELFPSETSCHFVSYPPPAPLENRPVYHRPIAHSDRKSPAAQAQWIREQLARHPGRNTLVHCSYRMSQELAPLLADLRPIVHTKDDKGLALERFKKRGGLLLACGMAEGVDLPGDLCRLILIPQLLYANLGDPAVKKRLELPGGDMWYPLTTALTTVQQVGRGVRGATDECISIIGDALFPKLTDRVGRYVNKGFMESIIWEGR